MKITIRESLLAAALAAFVCTAHAEQKIAFVDMEKAFDGYHKTKTANAQFKARGADIDAKRKDFLARVKELKTEFDALNAECRDKSLNDKTREKKREEAEDKLGELRESEAKLMDFDKLYKKEITDQMRQMQSRIVGEIRGVIQAYAAEHKIDIVLDSSGKTLNNVEAVMYFNSSLDITAPIMAIMNKNAPETGRTEEPAKTEVGEKSETR
ncbi:MAG: OmpH family outer membrane protein [Kiritimatiellae bacterium]|nr:OmpH family outer membrane protein [Kiritimatiellia bacterium]